MAQRSEVGAGGGEFRMTINKLWVPTPIPPNLQVLGSDEGGRALLWIIDRRRLWRVRPRDIEQATLVQMVGDWARRNIRPPGAEDDGRPTMTSVKLEIAQMAGAKTLRSEKILGQGIWKNPEGPGLMVVDGNLAVVYRRDGWGAKAKIRICQSPLCGGHLLELDEARRWCDAGKLVGRAAKITPGEAKQAYERLEELLTCWSFARPLDRTIIAALVIATSIQGALEFRPHVWITGGTNTGKTALLTMLKRLLPGVKSFEGETTEAGFRQSLNCDVLPVLLDEFERWPQRDKIIELLRVSTRGGRVARGTVDHRPVYFGMRHIVWVASIEVGLRRAADLNRFIIIELNTPEQIEVPDENELADLGIELAAAGLSVGMEVASLAQQLGKERVEGADRRLVECIALPAAVRQLICSKDAADTLRFITDVAVARSDLMDATSDEDQLIEDIMASKVRVSDGGGCPERAVAYLLGDPIHTAPLIANGIRRLPDGRVFLVPDAVCRHLLKDTRWARLNIRDILKRIPGAKCVRQRMGEASPYGVSIPGQLVIAKDEEPGVPSVPAGGTLMEQEN